MLTICNLNPWSDDDDDEDDDSNNDVTLPKHISAAYKCFPSATHKYSHLTEQML